MEFDYSDEQRAIQDSLQRWLGKHYAFEHRRAALRSGTGLHAQAWGTFAEMGLLALPLPEAHGGLGGNAVDVGLVMEQLGAAGVIEPYLATVVLGAGLLVAAGSAAQQAAWLPGVAEGRVKLAWAHQEPGMRHARHRIETRAVPQGVGWRLQGRKAVVPGAPLADQLLVTVRTSGDVGDADGLSLFLVDPRAPGVTLRAYANHDGQRAADVTLEGVVVAAEALVGTAGAALPAIEQVLDRGIAALCSEAVGVMGAMNALTLDYLKTRHQFGVAIGSFQALQHRMADMTVALELARSMTTLAAVKADGADAAERSRIVSGAKAYVGQQARFVGQQAIQMHGGMGLTDEMAISHLFKRLTMIEVSLGDTGHHFARFSRSLLAA